MPPTAEGACANNEALGVRRARQIATNVAGAAASFEAGEDSMDKETLHSWARGATRTLWALWARAVVLASYNFATRAEPSERV